MPTARRRSLLERTTFTVRADRLHPKALALLDILIGMALFVLIAIIAIISLSQLRQRGYVTGAVEDAAGLAISIEALATADANTTLPPTGGIVMSPTDPGRFVTTGVPSRRLFRMTQGNVATYTYVPPTSTTDGGFTVCVKHYDDGDYDTATGTVDAFAFYDSRAGGIVDSGPSGSGSC